MYLSDKDIRAALDAKKLIIDPEPDNIDATSVDLHLDNIGTAKIWDIDKYSQSERESGRKGQELRIGKYDLLKFSTKYLTEPPQFEEDVPKYVSRRDTQVIVKTGGFLLWQTREIVGTPAENAEFICFVDGKSTRARAGIVVHLTAPTIHASWNGKITLEIANLGPFDIVLQEDDVIAQLTISKISSPPERGMKTTSTTFGQRETGGNQQ